MPQVYPQLYRMQLYNKLDKETLLEQLEKSGVDRITLSFYQYARIEDPDAFRDQFFLTLSEAGVLGRIYVANEGINGQISVPSDGFGRFREIMNGIPFLKGARLNIAIEDNGRSFIKLNIKVRKKIVADGLDDATFDVTQTGTHLDAEAFNTLTDNPDTILVDMRNHYESEVGHFKGAITPDADTFREELPLVHDLLKGNEDKNIVMYCTGGIRCEKASAWFKHQGFPNVHQLEGGIIEYTRQVREKHLNNKFIGKNFVFDRRMSEAISDDIIGKCHQCGEPADLHTNCANQACHLLFIQCEKCAQEYTGCCSHTCSEFHALPEAIQMQLRKNLRTEQNVYRKGRFNKTLQAQLRTRLNEWKKENEHGVARNQKGINPA